MKKHSCPLCNKQKFNKLHTGLLKCEFCELIFDQSIWKESVNERMEEEWFEEGYINSSSYWVDIFEKKNNKCTWKRITPFVNKGKTLLEIGVGSGSFLAYAYLKGLRVMGCDLSSAICRNVEKRFNLPMFNGPIVNLPKEQIFDVIVMNHVLEHVNDPLRFLEDVKSHLNHNSMVHVSVPNVGSWEAKLPGWASYEPYHLLYFTPDTLCQTLERAGFKVIKLSTHESFSGWFLAILRTLLGINKSGSSNRQKKRVERRSLYIENAYRAAMVISGIVTYPLRYIQAELGYGDEIAVLAVPGYGGVKNEL